jgi:TolB-like protein
MSVWSRTLPATCALVVAVLGWGPSALGVKKPRLAVLAIKAEGVEATVASTVDETLTADLAKSSRYEVIGRSEIEAMAGFQSEQMKLGCTGDNACLAEIGGALGVDRLVFGSLGKVGNTYVLNTKLIEIRGAHVIARDTEVVNSPDALISAVERAAQILLGDLPAPLEATTESASSGGLRHSPWPWVTLGVAAVAGGIGGYFAYANNQNYTSYLGATTDTARAGYIATGNTDQLAEGILFGVAGAAVLTAAGMLIFGGGGQ